MTPVHPLRRLVRTFACLGLLALPITCSQSGDGIYSAGVEPSPSSRVNPMEPGFTNDGSRSR